MSDQVFGDDGFDDNGFDDNGLERGGGGVGGKRTILIILGVLLLLIAGGIAYAVYSGALDDILGGDSTERAGADRAFGGGAGSGPSAVRSTGTSSEGDGFGGPTYFYPPEMLVNLAATGGRNRFLKVSIALELDNSDDMSTIEQNLPRIIDMFQNYLHGLSIEQLQAGSAGLERLREELQARANDAVTGSNPVRRVLIQEMLVQ